MITRYDGTEYKLLAGGVTRTWIGTEEAYESEKDKIPTNTVIAITGDNDEVGKSLTTPIGSIISFAGATSPKGWLICDGSEISRIKYKSLYDVIGDTYGAGDGETTFNIPDLSNKVPMGGGTLGEASLGSLPNIEGSFQSWASSREGMWFYNYFPSSSGAFKAVEGRGNRLELNTSLTATIQQFLNYMSFSASYSSDLYKSGQTYVEPANVRMNYIIKAVA